MENLIMKDLKSQLEQYKTILKDWIPKKAFLAIAMNNQYVYFSEENHHFHMEIGQQIPTDSLAYRILQTNEKSDAVLDNSLFDTPYYAMGYPIMITNQLAALIVVLPHSYRKPVLDAYKILTGKQQEDWVPIQVEQISHIESLQKSTWFYKDSSQYKTTVTLKELETRLPDSFIRVHRSYIVNIHFIKKISRDITSSFVIYLKDHSEIPVSQSYITELRKRLEF
ncbi:MAG: LytTR family DNA-binding domain-containing protein [Solibacillus sp.]